MNDSNLLIRPPLFLVGKKIHCWKCQAKMPVVTLLAPYINDTENQVCLLSEIKRMPKELKEYIQKRVPTFKVKYSKTVRGSYFANTCPKCEMLSGDFYLHSEPGAPFFPTEDTEASFLYMTEIPLSSPIKVQQKSINVLIFALIM